MPNHKFLKKCLIQHFGADLVPGYGIPMGVWLILYGYFSLDGNGCNLLMNLVVYDDLLQKFVSNSCCFRNFHLKQGITLHPKIYQSIFFFHVKSTLNYAEKLKLTQIW
jgi:hypothetical protein